MRDAAHSTPRRRRSHRLYPAAGLALLALLVSAAAPALDAAEHEAELDEIVSRLRPDQAEAALREIFAAGTRSVVTESYAVSPASLRSLDSSSNANFFNSYTGYFVTQGAFWGCMYAPLHLPQGATVTGLVIWFVDTGAGAFTADIRRKSITSTAVDEVLGSVTSTDGAGIRVALDATISNGAIDNDAYVYYSFVCPSPAPGPELHGLYIVYER